MLLLWRMSKEKKDACIGIHCVSCCLNCASIIECLSLLCKGERLGGEKKKCGFIPCILACLPFRMFMKALGNE